MSCREMVIELVRKMPEEMSLAEMAREIDLLAGIETAREQARHSEGIPAEDARKLMDRRGQSPQGWHLYSWTIKESQSSIGAKSSGKGRKMPPRWGWGILALCCYIDVAPAALGKYCGRIEFCRAFARGEFSHAISARLRICPQ